MYEFGVMWSDFVQEPSDIERSSIRNVEEAGLVKVGLGLIVDQFACTKKLTAAGRNHALVVTAIEQSPEARIGALGEGVNVDHRSNFSG